MRLTCLLALCAATTLLAQEGYPTSYPSVPMAPKKTKTEPMKPTEEPARPAFDVHFLQPDEYLILDNAYKGGSGWECARLASLVTPASAETKGEAEFFILAGDKKGEKVWTKHYARTRPATKEDLKLGALAYHFDHGTEGDLNIYNAPQDRENLLLANWFIGTINDTSTLYKGFLSLSGYHCAPKGLRVAVKAGAKD